MEKLYLVVIGIVIVAAIAGFLLIRPKSESEVEIARAACVKACKDALNSGRDLSNGPCLLDPIESLPKWVCDVAHDPREDIDNKPENQCSKFREGSAIHFVEVNPNCEVIKIY